MPKKKKDGTGMSVRIDECGESHVTINDPDKIPKSYLKKNIEYQKRIKRHFGTKWPKKQKHRRFGHD